MNKVIIDDQCEIDNSGSIFQINHDVVIEGLNTSTDVNTGGHTTQNYGFAIYGPYNVEIRNIDIVGGGVLGGPLLNEAGNAYAGDVGPNILLENCSITTKYKDSGRNAIYLYKGIMTVRNTNITVESHYSTYYFAAASSTITVETTNEDGVYKGTYKGSGRQTPVNGSSVIIKGGTFDKDPTSWVAEGYVATKSGTNWVVAPDPNYVAPDSGE